MVDLEYRVVFNISELVLTISSQQIGNNRTEDTNHDDGAAIDLWQS
jgi:hypothetical protein